MTCPAVPEIPYGEFSTKLHQHTLSERIPLNGTLELTYRCNCNCLHCYCNLPANHPEAISTELRTEEVFSLIDQIVEQGCLWLLLTGGECLLRPDFMDIWVYAKKKGLLLTLFSNGTCVTSEIADFLSKWPPFSIEISIYGASKKTHDSVTRKAGSFDKCRQGIEILLSRNLPVKLKTMVLRENVPELLEMKKMARNLGVDFRFDAQINSRLNGETTPITSRLSPEEVVRLDVEDAERWPAWLNFSKKRDSRQTHDLFSCGAGLTSFSISPDGKLQPCGLLTKPNWDMRTISFNAAWQEMPQVRKQKPSALFRCSSCESYDLCGQCPGWSMTEHQKFDMPVDYLCQITKELVKVLPEKEVCTP